MDTLHLSEFQNYIKRSVKFLMDSLSVLEEVPSGNKSTFDAYQQLTIENLDDYNFKSLTIEIRSNLYSLDNSKIQGYLKWLVEVCLVQSNYNSQLDKLKQRLKNYESAKLDANLPFSRYFYQLLVNNYNRIDYHQQLLNSFTMIVCDEFKIGQMKLESLLKKYAGIDDPKMSSADINNLLPSIYQVQTMAKKLDNKNAKIKWNGKLKEFAELITELKDKGWIEINHGELKEAIQALKNSFDFTSAKKSNSSDEFNSLYQLLKPSADQIVTKRYVKKFNKIEPKS